MAVSGGLARGGEMMRTAIICALMALALAACSGYGSNSGSSSDYSNGSLGPAGTTDNTNAPNPNGTVPSR